MIRFKYLLLFCWLYSTIKISQGKRKQIVVNDLRSTGQTVVENSTGFNLFFNLEPSNQVTKVEKLWRWKSRSNALYVQNDVKQQIISAIRNSFSIEFRAKVKKSTIVSLFRITSSPEDGSALTWLDILMDYQRSKIKVAFMSENMIPERMEFDLIGSHNTWITFLITVESGEESTLSFATRTWPKQSHTLIDGISIRFPLSAQFEIGGRSQNTRASFTGFISKAVFYSPSLTAFPSPHNTRRSALHSKRGAGRKPLSRGETRSPTFDPSTLRSNTTLAITGSPGDLRTCLEGQRQLSSMLNMLKQSHGELQDRVTNLEACECRLPPCIAENGRSYVHNQTWPEDDCVSCRCHFGRIICESDTSCRVSPCDDVVCQNSGSCLVREDNYVCSCARGYRGRHCEEIDYCARRLCRNGATCELSSADRYRCICLGGFTGRHCENRDWCHRTPCLNEGSCVNGPRSYECTCPSGFSGPRCERKDWCLNSPCQNGGRCISNEQNYECTCLRGFSGPRCERKDWCYNSPCQNGGSCINNEQNYECACPPGFSGPRCERKDWCYNSPCQNGGRCISNQQSYECTCPPGFSGPRCERKDWCYNSPCQNRGRCISNQQSYECACLPGFSGPRCERKDWCYNSPCQNGGRCTSNQQGYSCECVEGFVGDSCQYSDLCETDPCNGRGTCSNLVLDDSNDFRCDCFDGYTGPDCGIVDVCGSNPCLNGGTCDVVGQIFRCLCLDGYNGDRCERRDPCFAEPCMNGATCRVAGNGFQCLCTSHFHGRLCEFENVCQADSCSNGGTCVPESGGFSCRCRQQFLGDRCQFIDYCRARPCRNGASCRNIPHSSEQPFTCDCVTGYTGGLCETVDVCVSNPCLNNGVCGMQGRNFICTCRDPYRGDRCEEIDYCSRDPCLNGGECQNKGRGFLCTCPESHMGRRCETPHPCRNNPCQNGGECSTASSGGYMCTCSPRHFGALCDKVNHCYNNPCQNGGRCLNTESGFSCSCRDGFVGDVCSTSDGCLVNPCLNGGRCDHEGSTTVCRCPPTHQGGRCEYQCNICMYLPDRGDTCPGDGRRNLERKWYYDKYTQSCKPMQYSGCGGNSNNFASRQECRQRCIVGACCMLHLSPASAALTCRFKSLGQCKRINAERNDIQIVSFKTGQRCSSDSCSVPTVCRVGQYDVEVGSAMDMGCRRSCSCLDGGVLDCPCQHTSVRKEVRRMTQEEMGQFQGAVKSLKIKDPTSGLSSWDEMRDEYMRRAPIAQSPRYYLLWNRAFLRKMELLLQKTNCRVTIPYYDFTLDAGRFNESVVWQPTYFGGDGACVPDHPFRDIQGNRATSWQPCLIRNFDHSITIPNMVDVALALTATNMDELGSNLFRMVSYVRAYIGGDMATSGSPYDPLFYPIHAYVDYLFTQWQTRHPDVELPPYSDSVFLGLPAGSVWNGACVTYASMSYLEPCNVTMTSSNRFGEDGFNLQGFSRDGFNRQGFDKDGYDVMGRNRFNRLDSRDLFLYDGYNAEGYNRSGYDRRGFNRYGFCDGYSRDGYDVAGYDRAGWNRYGLDRDGYNLRGFDVYGVSRDGATDQTDYYDSETGFSDCCFSRDGLTVSGLDKYGFAASGYDAHGCDYFYQGPFSLYYQHKLWGVLSVQPRTFLVSLFRTCGPLSQQPLRLIEQNWMSRGSRLPFLESGIDVSSHFSTKFCFDTEMLLSWCPCLEGNYPAVCHVNPCHGASCSLHPDARCHINLCGSSCSAEFYLRGRRVNCEDPCRSNPCANGGTCIASLYSSASERFQCQCLSGFTGSLCERQSADTCALPKLIGRCQGRVQRWFYNPLSRTCESFHYSGCGGNMNNFPHQQACQLRCSVGACCYRRVANISQVIGFDKDGYDKYGFNRDGYNRKGFHRSPFNSLPYGPRVFAPKGFDHDGYNIYGFNEDGYDRQGYDRQGYHHETGFNRTGYDRLGRFDGLHGFDDAGLNSSGVYRDGFRCNGLSSSGHNHFGFYKEYSYNCESMSQDDCDAMSSTHEVIAFSIGRTCDEMQCGDKCGCNFMGKLYKFGQQFTHGCRSCSCTLAGTISCSCQRLGRRKEIRDLTDSERSLYTTAIRNLYESDKWDHFMYTHFEYMPQAYGAYSSLPWHRIFLSNLEGELQKLAGCQMMIPYFDWTIDVGSLDKSFAWSASYLGGNGEEDTYCVNYHPFQNNQKWNPCIKRRFNPAISLPDAIDIQLLLREPDFKNFSIQLQAMSSLFHLWVGGHMASPFSAYDPLFVSHWAFIDRLWTEWQKRNPQGMPRFPLEHRYTQLKPFDITPDDVLASQEQLCVNYVPPTLGAPCNLTEERHLLARNADGFDRHGYDAEGFDIEGFDMNGRSRRGDPDSRNIYDENNFSPAGYHRSGFDSQGWDRFGYNRLDRNRDGIDADGYDVSGYDRFGFNREGETPFGMFRNGSFAVGADQGYAASLFDSFGYNRFGLNPNGLNRKGFNAYGFNVRGYDEHRCNYYNNGPYYMTFFFYGLTDIQKMPVESLKRIDRICKSITPLPESIARGWLGNVELIRAFERQWRANRVINPNYVGRTSSVTSDRLWLPLTPDKQFCFDLRRYSGCPVDTPLVDCPTDICQVSRCASHPQAQCKTKNCGSCYAEFFDGNTGDLLTCFGCIDVSGTVHGEGSSWDEQCRSCLCQGGSISCTPPMCSSLSCSHPARPNGQCCPTCEACDYNGAIYQSGQSFQNDRCESCQCLRGSVTCSETRSSCPQIDCPNPIRREGECCLTCPVGCEGHREGDRWEMGPCQTCTCTRGVMRCFSNRCPSAPCSHPYRPPSSCCPECDKCSFRGRLVENNQEFTEDSCRHCVCTNGNIACRQTQCARLTCPNQLRPPNQCCPVCAPGCLYEGVTYRDGEAFRPARSPCRNCTCQNNEVVCRGRQCRSVGTCPRPVSSGGGCCPHCSDCTVGDQVYRNHQVWTAANGCERCSCENGNIACERMYSCDRECTHGLTVPGRCCMECSRCFDNSRAYEDGETLVDERNPCRTCLCSHAINSDKESEKGNHSYLCYTASKNDVKITLTFNLVPAIKKIHTQGGNITCSPMSCPSLRCSSQVTKPGDCCPSCSSCFQGVEREHGSTWRMERDACTSCSCQEGKIRCRTDSCLPPECEYPVTEPGSCCGSCGGCYYNGVRFEDDATVPSSDPCNTCKCNKGNVMCEKRGCEDLRCLAKVEVPGQCCPRCASCEYEQETYDEGSTFISPRNPCLSCSCEDGEVTCDRIDLSCPTPNCPHAGRGRGVCCPTCSSCVYERRYYENGDVFTPPGASPCFVCSCANGTVECATTTCDAISCPNPILNSGECCPRCEVCEVDGVTYEPGDQWAVDACVTCSCDGGKIVCEEQACPTPTCSNPTQAPSSCCLTCDSCTISGHVFSHGQTFRHPTQTCQSCQCLSGNVNCESVSCTAPTCDAPVTRRGECCPSCAEQCRLTSGVAVANGMTIINPTNECQRCSCTNGSLSCDRRCNRDPPCRHPTDGECCRDSCDGCQFRGRKYHNLEEFTHFKDKCRRCMCRDGNVRCIRQRCPVLPCKNPVRNKDTCCRVCPEERHRGCTLRERSFSNGEQFRDRCQICRCSNGDIECRPQSCPPVSCAFPSRTGCCRECSGCTIDGTDYRDGEAVPSTDDPCSTCRCVSGNRVCASWSCSAVSCTHPVSDGCCSSCQGCLYHGETYSELDEFDSAERQCDRCTCVGGSVQCEREACPDANCTHPVTQSGSCCPVCGDDCLFGGSVFSDGSSFPKLDDQCRTCTCSKGSVVCQSKPCPEVTCRNPSTGQCGCSVCDECVYNGVSRRNRETFTNPLDEQCSECYCQDGNVNCGQRHCRSSSCSHPVIDSCNCPLCDLCSYHGRSYTSGQEFPDVEDTCNVCVCQDGNVECESKTCPDATCANPTLDRCGCPGCMDCNYLGVEYENHARFIDTMNKCNQCECRFGTIQCTHQPCPPVYCNKPVTPFGECCPECIGSCVVEGESFGDGDTFTHPSDPCSSCTCSSGEVQCIETRCGRSCTHPTSRNRCCPDCSGCLYQGQLLEDGEQFTPRNRPCQQCSCHHGNVVCREMLCPVLDCPNPFAVRGHCCRECPQSLQQGCTVSGQIREPGSTWISRLGSSCSECSCSEDGEVTCVEETCESDCSHPVPTIGRCCKLCTSCYYDNHTYTEGQLFHPNSCQDCMCRRGSVQCVTKACQPLACPLRQQVQSRDHCCPRCVSCITDQQAHAEEDTWLSPDDECVTCQCHNGVVTCQPIMCVPACQQMISIPGRCCPICNGCRYGNKIYRIGDEFESNPMNPCETCQCLASPLNGSPILSCHQVSCPSLADCPRSCVAQPEAGTCCPTCSNRPECTFGDCTAELRGKQLHPFDDPCFSCVCNLNTTWECSPMACPSLDCPQSERYTPKGSCCPICDNCHMPSEDRRVISGFAWKEGDCRSCQCDHGSIVCQNQQCHLPLDCVPPAIPHRESGECCEKCVDPHATCFYEGHTISSGHRWLVDKCTTCRCYAGKITCATQRCRMLMCNADELATVLPGECCPRCLSSPGRCVAFGEPHYQTFDGRMVHFQGKCRYLLTADCMKNEFRVEVENTGLDGRYGDVSWTDKVYFIVAHHRITLTSDYQTLINGTSAQLPLLIKPHLFIDRTTSHIILTTGLGVQLLWNGQQRHLEVSVPGKYKRRTCGLCGNFNSFPQDDLRLKNSRMTTSDSTFGNNWKVSVRRRQQCPDVQPHNPCDGLPYSLRKKANNACKILRSPTFSACHQVVNPEMYFAACVHDSCACGSNNKFCLCDALEAYASRCRRSGVVLDWRSANLCAISCPTARGYVFDECGSPCKRTCANRNLPPDEIDRQCYMPCVPGCQCVAGKVEHEGRCITASLCPDSISAIELAADGQL